MSGEIIQFPADGVTAEMAEVIKQANLPSDLLHAFRDLENPLCDCKHMARIAVDRVMAIRTDDEEMVFAVRLTWEMIDKLLKDYYAAYERQP